MIQGSEIIEIGHLIKTHGIKGEMNAILDVDIEIFDHTSCLIFDIDGIYVPHFVQSVRPKGSSSCLIMIEEIKSEEEAKLLVDKSIFILKNEYDDFIKLISGEEGGGYASDFIGYKIVDESLGDIGIIDDIETSTENALFIVTTDNDSVYIPITEDFITAIDDDNKIIEMSLPSGILEL